MIQRRMRLWAIGASLAVLSAGIPLVSRTIVGPPGAIVHIRWQPSLDASGQRNLETRFGLIGGRHLEDRTWRYELVDTSRDNVRAIVRHEAVADTHHIDRTNYGIDAAAERTVRRSRFGEAVAAAVGAFDTLAVVLGVAALALLAMGSSDRTARWLTGGAFLPAVRRGVQRAATAFVRWIHSRVPPLDATAFGAFRTALGVGLVWVALKAEVNAIPLDLQRHYGALDWPVVHWIAASPHACALVKLGMVLSAVLFAVGLSTRRAYATFVAAYFLATLIMLETTGAHDMGLPLVTFLGWLTVKWADGPGIDRWRRGPSQDDAAENPSAAYGFAIWWPGLTLGAALLAAAIAKLNVTGLDWIAGGAVKYHFVLDADHAHVDWGLRVASHHWMAVLLSLGAIVFEAGFIANIFMRGPASRLAVGMAGAGLFLGLYLFQGIYWPGWLVLFMAFLPWTLLNRASAPASAVSAVAPAPAAWNAQVTAVAVLLGTQTYASATQTQAEPLLSHFPMYSNSYASPEAFEHARRWQLTRIVSVRADGQDFARAAGNLRDEDLDLLVELAVERSVRDEPLDGAERPGRSLVCERYTRVLGSLPAEVTFTLERTGFDWTAGRFREYVPLSADPVPLAKLCGAASPGRLAR